MLKEAVSSESPRSSKARRSLDVYFVGFCFYQWDCLKFSDIANKSDGKELYFILIVVNPFVILDEVSCFVNETFETSYSSRIPFLRL